MLLPEHNKKASPNDRGDTLAVECNDRTINVGNPWFPTSCLGTAVPNHFSECDVRFPGNITLSHGLGDLSWENSNSHRSAKSWRGNTADGDDQGGPPLSKVVTFECHKVWRAAVAAGCVLRPGWCLLPFCGSKPPQSSMTRLADCVSWMICLGLRHVAMLKRRSLGSEESESEPSTYCA